MVTSSSSATNGLIECQGVTKTFGGVVANDDIALSVPPGRITGLIGPKTAPERRRYLTQSSVIIL